MATTLTQTLMTHAHAYDYDLRKPADAEAYNALRTQLKASHPHKMKSLTERGASYLETGRRLEGRDITLDPACLFENQWNTVPLDGISDKGLRVFDWAEDAIFDSRGNEAKHYRRGYWLDQTDDMRAIRANVSKCGYCGHQKPTGAFTFCPDCIDSEYLKESDLRLTRMRPVNTPFATGFDPLTETEQSELIPKYREAQLHGTTERGKARIIKARASVIAKCEKEIRDATIERDGFLWWMDRGIRTDNLIYYSHTGVFSFGWRTPIDASLTSAILDLVSEFPFPYQLITADGRKLESVVARVSD